MSDYREIITKAVVAKGRKFTQSTHIICPPYKPTSILGCWIINHTFEAKKVGKKVEVSGCYDINVWYSHSDNKKTSVVTETVHYTDVIKLKHRDPDALHDDEVVARVLQNPNCTEAVIAPCGEKIIVHVEREFLVEVIGETKVCVLVNPDACEDCDDDDWEEELDEELEDLDPDFLIGGEEE